MKKLYKKFEVKPCYGSEYSFNHYTLTNDRHVWILTDEDNNWLVAGKTPAGGEIALRSEPHWDLAKVINLLYPEAK